MSLACDDDGRAWQEATNGVWCNKHQRVYHGDECELCVAGVPAYTIHGQPMKPRPQGPCDHGPGFARWECGTYWCIMCGAEWKQEAVTP